MNTPAAFIVTLHDSHGFPVHVYGVCTACAAEDSVLAQVPAVPPTGKAETRSGDTVQRALPNTTFTCERCDDADTL
jgi:hypothetical protein